MKAAGIVAEYNPLHNGHVYHISQARKIAGIDAVVVAMSGDWVQRGEPAIFDKWTRTLHALRCGADLVIEIPSVFCLGDAGQYARAGTGLLEAVPSVTHAVFGSESGDTEAISSAAHFTMEHEDEIREGIMKRRSDGLSYPAAREAACIELASEYSAQDFDPEILRNPNDILALEYVINMRRLKPAAVRRIGAGYNDEYDGSFSMQSASAVRKLMRDGEDTGSLVPECVAETAAEMKHMQDAEIAYSNYLRYAVLMSSADELDECPSGGEGIGSRLIDAVRNSASYGESCRISDIIMSVKSKRHTYTRISRLCAQAVLGIKRDDIAGKSPGYIRVLGATGMGRELLSEMREGGPALPVITNINKECGGLDEAAAGMLRMDIHAADVYNLINGRDLRTYSDHRMHPVML